MGLAAEVAMAFPHTISKTWGECSWTASDLARRLPGPATATLIARLYGLQNRDRSR